MKENTTAAGRGQGVGEGREGTHGRIRVSQKMSYLQVHSPFVGVDVLFHEGISLAPSFF